MAEWIGVTSLVAIIGVASGFVWYVRRGSTAERRLKRLFGEISSEQLRDFAIPDGTGGEIQIACLLKTSHGLIVLDINDTDGTVFAGDRLDTWSATHNGQRITFENPITQLQRRLEAIALIARGAPLEGRILFVGEAEFPKGAPPLVATVDTLLAEFNAATQENDATHLDHHWALIRQEILD